MKNTKEVLLRRYALFAGLAAVGVLTLIVQSAGATVIAYEGFGDGGIADGRSAGATAYTTAPASTDGLDNDSLHTQSPISTGFADANVWTNLDPVAATVYYQAQSGGLIYPSFKPSASGKALFFRGSGITSDPKRVERPATTTDISDVQWVAMLVNFSSAPSNTWYQDFIVTLQHGEPQDNSTPYDGAWTPATFGVRQSDGKAFYRTAEGGSKVDVETASALSPGTHLFLLKFDDRPGTGGADRYDDVTLWVDPELTANPDDLTGGLAAVSITRSDLGGTMHPLDKLNISAAVKSGSEIVFDEFIMTDDYQDIYIGSGITQINEAFQTVDATYIRTGTPPYTSYSPDANYNDVGQIIVGHTAGEVLRGLIEFDLSSLPSGIQIASASLNMTTYSVSPGINNVGGPGDFTLFNLYQYGFDIDETTATWNEPDADASDVPGGTSGTLLSSTSFDVEQTGQGVAFGDSAAFRAAVSDALLADKVLRLILRGNDDTLGAHNFARFSDETVTPASDRPELQVNYRFSWQGTIIMIN